MLTRQETLYKISHYQWMLDTMTLRPAHQLWIGDQIEDLTDSLSKFYPASHPYNKVKPC